jgi:hypothetical protein
VSAGAKCPRGESDRGENVLGGSDQGGNVRGEVTGWEVSRGEVTGAKTVRKTLHSSPAKQK